MLNAAVSFCAHSEQLDREKRLSEEQAATDKVFVRGAAITIDPARIQTLSELRHKLAQEQRTANSEHSQFLGELVGALSRIE